MKVSVRALEQYIGKPLPPTEELVAKIGAQLGAVEEVIELGPQYSGPIIVSVISCVDHENSDHLHVCLVDDGGAAQDVERTEQGYVQVVCGAPNVRAGMKAVWLPPGSIVPESYHGEQFILGTRPLRGVLSNGMLASPRELALGDSHEGILEITDDSAPGTRFADAFELDDTIIDIENKMFTHRPDCFGQLGVAREVAAILGYDFTSPDWYLDEPVLPAGNDISLAVENSIPQDVPRFMAIALHNVHIAPSPVWLQTYLARLGIRPINNVVDITNYVMVVTGQPLHAYDYAKVRAYGTTMGVRYPKPDETVELLNGKTITPRAEAILITAGDQPIGLGGVMGGANTEVDEQTTAIILEAATFNMYSIRRTSMAHGIFSDAVTRFTKGQSPLQNDRAAVLAVKLLTEYAQASVTSNLVDVQHEVAEPAVVHVDPTLVNGRLGLSLADDEMAALLRRVECGVTIADGRLSVQPPFWRTDLAIAEDIIEEVGRLYGFDRLPLDLPLRSTAPAPRDELLQRKAVIRQVLSRAGANELLTYSFVHGNLLDKVGQQSANAFQISNALSPDLQFYRLTLLPSLLDKVHSNVKAGYDSFALFELGKTHHIDAIDSAGLPLEEDSIALVFAAHDKAHRAGAAYYQAQTYLMQLGRVLGVQLRLEPVQSIAAPYQANRSAAVYRTDTDEHVGVIGELLPEVRKSLKLPQQTAGFELSLQGLAAGTAARYQALPRFPKIEQDICFRVPVGVTYGQVYALVQDGMAAVYEADAQCTVTPVDIYQATDQTDYKQITVRVAVAHYERTLTSAELAKHLDQLSEIAATTYNAERV